MIFGQPNLLATVALAAWFPLSFLAFWLFRPSVAAALTIIVGRLFLPEQISLIALPIFPDLSKEVITLVAALLGCLVTARRQLAAAKPMRGIDLWIIVLLLGDAGTVWTNPDPVFADPPKPPLTNYDMWTQIVEDLVLIYGAFFLGRAMFRTSRQMRSLLYVCLAAALIYTPFCLFELKMGPQANIWVYGYLQHDPAQAARGGGFRPMVFLDHGLTLARFMLTAVIAGVLLLRARMLPFWLILPLGYLFVVFFLLKSTGALLLGIIFVPLIAFASVRMQLRVAMVLAILIGLYPLLRGADLFPATQLLEWAGMISPERADSLKTRFDNEEALVERARKRLWFGWGTYARGHVFDPETGEDTSITDGEWIVALSSRGLCGYVAHYALYLIPIFTAVRNARRIRGPAIRLLLAGLTLVSVILAIDTLPNSAGSWPHFFFAGVLHGATRGILRQDRLARLKARWEARKARAEIQRSGRPPIPARA
jgi:hypothetical protein